jgi:aminoglycoside phosphotransferase (APT) family kinase protein
MATLLEPVEAIRAHLAKWITPYVDLDTFGTAEPHRIAALVDAFCRDHLGSGVAGYIFCQASVGATHGVELDDGRRVVLKVHQPTSINPDREHGPGALDSIHRVLEYLHARGFPCPEPLLRATPLGVGLATVQEYLEVGERGDGFDPAIRRAIAEGLVELMERLAPLGVLPGLRAFYRQSDRLYPTPHSKLFDFEATAEGAKWIDDLARRGKESSPHAGPAVLTHGDWRCEHLRFRDGRVSATYDWEALMPLPETEVVGVTAASFTTDWSSYGEGGLVPTVPAVRAFVDDYEDARGRPFSVAERRLVFGTAVFTVAYGARCQHSLEPERRDWPANSWPGLLRAVEELL